MAERTALVVPSLILLSPLVGAVVVRRADGTVALHAELEGDLAAHVLVEAERTGTPLPEKEDLAA